jgi:mannose-6-phosphate isomerase class I
VTLLEPQNVVPGKRGVTYRFWDWNRRYDDQGRPSERGAPRPLHVAESLEATDWAAPRGAAFLEWCCSRPRSLAAPAGLTHVGRIDSPYFVAEEWAGSGEAELAPIETLLALTCLAGECEVRTSAGACALRCGESAVVAAASGDARLLARDARVFVTFTALD